MVDDDDDDDYNEQICTLAKSNKHIIRLFMPSHDVQIVSM